MLYHCIYQYEIGTILIQKMQLTADLTIVTLFNRSQWSNNPGAMLELQTHGLAC
jgi:hypothetical protein